MRASETQVGQGAFCAIAGYLVQSLQAQRLVTEWNRVLDRWSLPFFRMSACAHGNAPFQNLTKSERVQIQTSMIECIRRRTLLGLAVTVSIDEYARVIPKHPLIGSAYTFCAHVVIGGVQDWVKRNNYGGDVAYFFEAGHQSEREANQIMQRIFRHPELKQSTRYHGHSFVIKEDAPPVQAADLLAWQWYTDMRRQREGKPRRQDCFSLMRHPHWAVHLGPERLAPLANAVRHFDPATPDDIIALINRG